MPVKSSLLALLLLFCGTARTFAADDYQLGPDSQRQEGVPKGKVVTGKWTSEKVFPGTVRDYWIYTPAQYDGSKPACLMVFQDGGGYVNENGQFRVPVVFDNLIHRKEMPVTIGIFLSPGTIPAAQPGQKDRSNRSFEYDSLGDQYSKFLIDELLPGLVEKYSLKLTDDPEGRGICGISSGGICAFTVAWERPDKFRKVISHIGSFTNIRGGHFYPALIRPLSKDAPATATDADHAHPQPERRTGARGRQRRGQRERQRRFADADLTDVDGLHGSVQHAAQPLGSDLIDGGGDGDTTHGRIA